MTAHAKCRFLSTAWYPIWLELGLFRIVLGITENLVLTKGMIVLLDSSSTSYSWNDGLRDRFWVDVVLLVRWNLLLIAYYVWFTQKKYYWIKTILSSILTRYFNNAHIGYQDKSSLSSFLASLFYSLYWFIYLLYSSVSLLSSSLYPYSVWSSPRNLFNSCWYNLCNFCNFSIFSIL